MTGMDFQDRPLQTEAARTAGTDPFAEYSAGIPTEPRPGAVIAFTLTEDGRAFSPVTAMRAVVAGSNGRQWYLCGPKVPSKPITWDALLDLVGEDRWSSIRMVESWVVLP